MGDAFSRNRWGLLAAALLICLGVAFGVFRLGQYRAQAHLE